MQIREINYGGKKLVYRAAGEGPPVVLLHGFGEEGSVWKEQFGLFPNHRLVVPDLPGSGASEAIEDMSMEGLADAVKAMMDDANSPQPMPVRGAAQNTTPSQSEVGAEGLLPTGEAGGAVVIGHSMGGYVTLALAEKYPESLLAFGLFHSTAFADSEDKKEVRQKGIRFIEEHGAAGFLKTSTPDLYAPKTREEHPGKIEEHLATTHNFSGGSLVSYYKAMIRRPDRTAVLRKSSVPVLFVMGRHDNAVLLTDGLAQCRLPQIAYIHILEHSGHTGMIEEPDEAARILSQFVNDTQKTA